MPDLLASHYRTVAKAIADGRVIPFFGAGVNLCGRPAESGWERGESLPSGGELARYLADQFDYPEDDTQDLLRVSQYATVMQGAGPLYEQLRALFDGDYPPTTLHQFFAGLSGILREKGYPRSADPLRRRLLIVTTNYDDLMERAFKDVAEPFHVISYVATGDHRGRFVHWALDGSPTVIEAANDYRGLLQDQAAIILKIHGAVDRTSPKWDSFVITEDNYIDYLTRTDIASLLPVPLPARLRTSHFLFLGYSLRDWNLRVILHRIWGEQKLDYKSWAIQLNADSVEKEFWNKRDVEILSVRLEEYCAGLFAQLNALAPAASSK